MVDIKQIGDNLFSIECNSEEVNRIMEGLVTGIAKNALINVMPAAQERGAQYSKIYSVMNKFWQDSKLGPILLN